LTFDHEWELIHHSSNFFFPSPASHPRAAGREITTIIATIITIHRTTTPIALGFQEVKIIVNLKFLISFLELNSQTLPPDLKFRRSSWNRNWNHFCARSVLLVHEMALSK
jgi:hypothetical protein